MLQFDGKNSRFYTKIVIAFSRTFQHCGISTRMNIYIDFFREINCVGLFLRFKANEKVSDFLRKNKINFDHQFDEFLVKHNFKELYSDGIFEKLP